MYDSIKSNNEKAMAALGRNHQMGHDKDLDEVYNYLKHNKNILEEPMDQSTLTIDGTCFIVEQIADIKKDNAELRKEMRDMLKQDNRMAVVDAITDIFLYTIAAILALVITGVIYF